MHRRFAAVHVVLLGLIVLPLTSCSQVDITGRRQLNFVPDSLMSSMSLSEYQAFIKGATLSEDTGKTAMVRRVGGHIAEAVAAYCNQHGCDQDVGSFQWEFNLVEDPNVNAWAMPGGKVVVYTGLLPVAQDDTGLAVVLGHEIAHAFAEHGAERMSHGLLFQLGGVALDVAMREQPEQTRSLLLAAYGAGGTVGVMLPFSRLQESEADELGLIFMALAGYDPAAAIPFWQRMAAQKEGKAPPEFLSTHPSDERRIEKIRALLPEVQDDYRRAKVKRP